MGFVEGVDGSHNVIERPGLISVCKIGAGLKSHLHKQQRCKTNLMFVSENSKAYFRIADDVAS